MERPAQAGPQPSHALAHPTPAAQEDLSGEGGVRPVSFCPLSGRGAALPRVDHGRPAAVLLQIAASEITHAVADDLCVRLLQGGASTTRRGF